MKDTQQKAEYIRLRAEGNSYSVIAKELGISKSTCSSWEKDLADRIDSARREHLEELAESYGIAKEARVKRLGEILQRIDSALDQTDFTTISPEKLLQLRSQYSDRLKEEYYTIAPLEVTEELTAERTLEALGELLGRARTGEANTEQIKQELQILLSYSKIKDNAERESFSIL